VIHALDECPKENGERGELCITLRDIMEWKKRSIHVLIVDREENDLIKALKPLCTMAPISPDLRAIDEESKTFGSMLEGSSRLMNR
jgi:hypothetical protein